MNQTRRNEDGVVSLLVTLALLVAALMVMSGNGDDTELRSPLSTPATEQVTP